MRKNAKPRVMSLLLALVMVLGLLPRAAWAADAPLTGDGTADSPYLIADAEDLAAFRDLVNASDSNASHATLIDDIHLNNEAWVPFASQSEYPTTAYEGTFDGDGHTIWGLSISADTPYQGLFGAINGATIKNLSVDGHVTSSNNYVGGIVGKIQQGTVENCSFAGSVTTTRASGYVGGIAGHAGNTASQTATISGCVNLGSVSGETKGVAGGIVGYGKYATIQHCYNTGAISGGSRSGGIAGQLQNNCTATSCYNLGSVSGSTTAGEICDFLFTSSSLSGCYGDGVTAGAGTGTITDCGPIDSADSLLAKLGSPFAADTDDLNGGWPILSWQADGAPVPKDPKITIIGSADLYDTNSGPKPSTTLTIDYVDLEPVPVTWSLVAGDDVVALVTPDNADEDHSTISVQALAPGKATVRAETGDYSHTHTITVWPFVTTVEIEGTVAAGESVKAKIHVLGGGTLDEELLPSLKVQWKYLTSEDYAAGNTNHYQSIPGATGLTYTIPEDMAGDYLSFELRYRGEDRIPSSPTQILVPGETDQPESQPPLPSDDIQELLRWYTMRPVFGQDSNVSQVLAQYLTDQGFAGFDVAIQSVTQVYGGGDIAQTGDITYYYIDPNTTPAVRFSSHRVVFLLSKGGETLTAEVPVILGWDVDRVKAVMRDEISGNVILDTADAVVEDLSLPKVVDDKRWTLISWQSSDSDVLSISSKNQTNADTLFNPYVGIVKRGDTDQSVTLTATFHFQLANDVTGSETPIALVHTYPITVKALDSGDKGEIEADLLSKLDAGFAAKGLTDSVSGARLAPDERGVYAVANDIQLPTTRDFGVDGKYYPVTITTSNDAALKAPDVNNAARVAVYRPAVGEGETHGTITVTLHDRDTSVTASRTFHVSVPALTQAEIDAELALMARVKAAYFQGIQSGNAGKDDVRSDLAPFYAVYEKAGALVWVHTDTQRTEHGIVPVPIEGWEDLELWRLFKSSNPNVISHETLRVTRQPEPKAVTITSRLSSEALGRYGALYLSDPAGYPQYAALAPLHYQEVTTSASILPEAQTAPAALSQGDTIVVRGTRDPNRSTPVVETVNDVTITLTGLDRDVWIAPMTLTGLDERSTVYDVFVKMLGQDHTATRVKGTYIKAISGPKGTLTEQEYGEHAGWMYRVNGAIPDVYMGACPLDSGDTIQVFYTRDASQEDPDWHWPSGGSGSDDGSSNDGAASGKPEGPNGPLVQVKPSDPAGTYTVTLSQDRSGPQLVTIPHVGTGQLVVILHPDGREEVVRKSILNGTQAKFFLNQDTIVKLVDYSNAFGDVADSAWYSSAVDFVSGRGLFSGIRQDTFAPHLPLSRGMLATVLYQLEAPAPQNRSVSFADVASGAWYEDATAWAAETGIVSGYGDGRFGPEDSTTREQLAVMLFHYAQRLGISTGGRDSLAGFSDGSAAAPWAQDAVAWAVDTGILSGLPDGTLDPTGMTTRAEAATMLQGFVGVLLHSF